MRNQLLQRSLMDTDCWDQFTFSASISMDSWNSRQSGERGSGRAREKSGNSYWLQQSVWHVLLCDLAFWKYLQREFRMRSDWIFKTMTDAFFPPSPNTRRHRLCLFIVLFFVFCFFPSSVWPRPLFFCPCTYRTLMDLEGPIYSEVWLLSAGACRGIWRWDADYPRAVQTGAPAACTHSTKSRVINNWAFVGGKAWKLSWLGSH